MLITLIMTSMLLATMQIHTAGESDVYTISTRDSVSSDHDLWDQLLGKHVSASGQVDYQGFKSDEDKLDQYLQNLAESVPGADTDRRLQMSYWINAYNAFTIKLILKHFPVASIMDIYGGEAWDQAWIQLGGKTYTLNEIEHEILRPVFKDARIHFAVNCAAKSCPPLANSAYHAETLEEMLDQQTRSFINNPKFNKLTPAQLELSRIFDWYGSDFGDVTSFINQYSTMDIKASAKINWLDYDWSLNAR